MSPRDRILARRASFIAAALTSITGCSSSDPTPQADAGVDARDTGAQPCLSADVSFDTGAEPCLEPPFDSGAFDTSIEEDTATTDTGADTGPMPCLAPPPGDTG
jgi:hypothetical protein